VPRRRQERSLRASHTSAQQVRTVRPAGGGSVAATLSSGLRPALICRTDPRSPIVKAPRRGVIPVSVRLDS